MAFKNYYGTQVQTGGSGLSLKKNEKPSGDILSLASTSVVYVGYTGANTKTTNVRFLVEHDSTNIGKKIKVKVPKCRFFYISKNDGTGTAYETKNAVADENGVCEFSFWKSLSETYKYLAIEFDNDIDLSKVYALLEQDFVDVDLHRHNIEWEIKEDIPYTLTNLYDDTSAKGFGLIDGSNGYLGTAEGNTYAKVSDFVECSYGDAIWCYYEHILPSMAYMCIGLFDADKTYLGRMVYYNLTEPAWLKFCVSNPNAKYFIAMVNKTGDRYIVRTDSDYPAFDKEDVSAKYGVEFLKNFNAPNQIDNTPLKRFEGKKLLVCGDSITEANSTNNRFPWCNFIARWFGMELTNAGVSGSGLYKYGSNNYSSLYHRLYYRANNAIFMEGTSYDYIILHGFMNDGSSARDGQLPNGLPVGNVTDSAGTASVYGALRGVFNYLIQYYPLAKIGFVCSTPRGQDSSVTRDDPAGTDSVSCNGHGWFERYIEAYKYVCEEYNIPFLDLYHNSPFRVKNEISNQEYFGQIEYDTEHWNGVVHPSSYGGMVGIAYPVYEWMKTYL